MSGPGHGKRKFSGSHPGASPQKLGKAATLDHLSKEVFFNRIGSVYENGHGGEEDVKEVEKVCFGLGWEAVV